MQKFKKIVYTYKEEVIRRGLSGGRWITYNGIHIFIKNGETFAEAFERNKKINDDWAKTHKQDGTTCKTEAEGNTFKQALIKAKETQPRALAWRVDTDTHEGKDYVGTKTYISEKGSTFSVTKDGDIISVCVNKFDTIRGSELIEKAVKAGGKKLDSYDGNFFFYLKNGFEPVSYVNFDPSYKIKGRRKGRDAEEPIIFFKYTGNKVKSKDAFEIKRKQFYKNVKPSKDYNTAMAIRDKEV